MRSILFVELLGGIGDVLIGLSALQSLSRSHPHASMTVLTFAPGGELLEQDPLIDRVEYASQGEARQAVKELLDRHAYDLVVSDTTYAGIDQLILSSGVPTVVTNLWRSPSPDQFVGERFVQILQEEGLIAPDQVAPGHLYLTEPERQQAETAIADLKHPLVFLIVDAGMEIKQWSPQNFIQLGQRLQAQFNATVIVPVGSSLEQATQIVAGIGGTARLWQRSTLRNLAAVMGQADLVVAADTGPARIAAALAVPTITLFGPSWYQRYGQPLPHVNLQGYPECPERVIQNFTEQRCWYGGVCPFDQWRTCLEAISVDRVMTVASSLLNFKGQLNSKDQSV